VGLTELLHKYKDQKPKTFGHANEREYPVSAVTDIVVQERKNCAIQFGNFLNSVDNGDLPDFKTMEEIFDWFLSNIYEKARSPDKQSSR
jgi:hypothetical protein